MLYICPSPIGNLKDISLRCLEVLESVDKIGCEDKRVSAKLLKHYQINKPLFSYHQHNEQKVSEQIITDLKAGLDIALLSDAGMPLISDPGEILMKKVIESSLEYTILPGANAAITALVAAKVSHQNFYFGGFIKDKAELLMVKELSSSLIFYEAPHRLIKTLNLLKEVLGDRELTIAREISKLYEEFYHGTISSALEYFGEKQRGEFVLVLAGYREELIKLSQEEVFSLAEKRLEEGERAKVIAKDLASRYEVDRQEIYKYLTKRGEFD